MKVIIYIFAVLLYFNIAHAGWEHTYGFGWSHETGRSVIQNPDNSYLICGTLDSIGSTDYSAYLVKTDNLGNLLWERLYGGSDNDWGYCIIPAMDDGYYMVGSTKSFGSSECKGWLLKINSDGDTLWTKTYGPHDDDWLLSADLCHDGIVMAGGTVIPVSDSFDVWLIKTDFDGNILWSKEYGGARSDICYSVKYVKDLGFILVGVTRSFGTFLQDVYIILTDLEGDTIWTRTYGGYGDDVGYSVVQTSDYGFIIAGYTTSFIPITPCVLFLKMDIYGDTVWSKIYGDYDTDVSYSIDAAEYGGFISCGWTNAFGAGGSDFWLLRIDRFGDTLWTKTYGGPNAECSYCVRQTTDGGFIIVGSTYSFGYGGRDVYVVKTDSLGETEWIREVASKPEEFSLNVYPNPFNSSVKIEIAGLAPLDGGAYLNGVEIFDINGRVVEQLGGRAVEQLDSRAVGWEGRTSSPTYSWTPDESVGSGVYLVRAKAGKEVITKKVVYLK